MVEMCIDVSLLLLKEDNREEDETVIEDRALLQNEVPSV